MSWRFAVLLGAALLVMGACRRPRPSVAPSAVADQVFGDQLRQARGHLARQEWLAARARLTDICAAVPTSNPIGSEAHALLAKVAFELGEYSDAERAAAAVPSDSPSSADARETRGLALMFTCRFEEAEAELFELAKVDEARGRVWLGMLFAWTGADGNASREFSRVLELAPNSVHASNARFYRAQLAFWRGQSEVARAELNGLGPYLGDLSRRAQNWSTRETHLLRAYFTFDTLSRYALLSDQPQVGTYDGHVDRALATLVRSPGACAPHIARLGEARREFLAARRAEQEQRQQMMAAQRLEHLRRTRDTDADSIPDIDDQCPQRPETYNGVDDADGCPESTAAVELRGNQIVIRRGHAVHFATGSASVLDESQSVLDAVSRILRDPDYSYIRLVRIDGHTDEIGDPEQNMQLSRRRAEAVGMALVSRGNDQSRLALAHFGSTRPIDLSGSDAAQARNRRVEFHVLDPRIMGGARRRGRRH